MLGTGCKRLPIIAALAIALAGCGGAPAGGPKVEIEDAWVRLPAVPGRPAAAYFHLRTERAPATLVKVASPLALKAEMHESASMSGLTTMTPLTQVTIAADSSETFAPGGRHVMLFDLSPRVRRGDTIPLQLSFAGDREPAMVEAKVIGPADPAPRP